MNKNSIFNIIYLNQDPFRSNLGSKFNVVHIEVCEEDEFCNLLKHLLTCVRLIKGSIDKKENVIVVCNSGISLSCSMIIAFLIKEKGMLLNNAVNFVRSKY